MNDVKSFSRVPIHNYLNMASKWPCDKKRVMINNISAGVCWGMWLTRNHMVFHKLAWTDMKMMLIKVWKCFTIWKPMFKGGYRPTVQLHGGGPLDPFGDWRSMKKLKLGVTWLSI